MKKLVSIFLALMLIFSFAACSKAAEEETTVKAVAAEESEPEEDILRLLLLLPGNAGDKSFNDSAIAGFEILQEKYGEKVETKYIELGDDDTKYESALYSASEDGWDIIVSLGFGFIASLQEVAPLFPDTHYILCDAVIEADNVLSISYKPNEGSFLAGYLGAKMSETGTLGFMGAYDIPLINDFLVGYIEGAQFASEDITIKIGYVGSFGDPAKAKEISITQYNNAVDICYNVAGSSGLGLIEAAVEMDKLVIGVDSDQAMIFADTEPEKSGVIPTSMVKDVGGSIVEAIDQYLSGTVTFGRVLSLGLEEGVIGLADNRFYQEMVDEELRTEIDALAAKIAGGEIKVTSAIGLTPDELSEFKARVQ